MRYAAGLLVVALAVVAAAHLWLARPAPQEPDDAVLELPTRLTLIQRHDADVPGSNGRLRVHIGDITRGQVELTLSHRDGRVLIPATSMTQHDRRRFSFAGRRYGVEIAILRNNLLGDDWAELLFHEGPSERELIEMLLECVRESSLTFVRNGKPHVGAEAAAHLRRKWEAAGERIATAEQFIEHVGTRSSTSGQRYEVRLANGSVAGLDAWFGARLENP
ncbi:MAG: DUF5329 family protein [Planctomycetota bacterium]|jgi:hypothetical protein